MPSLYFVDLNNNQFSGSLDKFAAALPPADAAKPSVLFQLRAQRNSLSGALSNSLPSKLGIWNAGLVDSSFGPLSNVLDLSDNQFEGEVPQSWYISSANFFVEVRPPACPCAVLVCDVPCLWCSTGSLDLHSDSRCCNTAMLHNSQHCISTCHSKSLLPVPNMIGLLGSFWNCMLRCRCSCKATKPSAALSTQRLLL